MSIQFGFYSGKYWVYSANATSVYIGKNQNEYYKYQGCGIIHSEKDDGLNPPVYTVRSV